MKQSFEHQAGDTIVEVIIAIAVVATILVGAFVVTNRSVQAVRDSEEHAEALQILQGQVELLRNAADVPGTLTAAAIAPHFCLGTDTQTGDVVTFAAGNNQCTGANGNIPFTLTIQCSSLSSGCPAAATTTTTFDLTATWPALGGGTDTVFLSYKVAVK